MMTKNTPTDHGEERNSQRFLRGPAGTSVHHLGFLAARPRWAHHARSGGSPTSAAPGSNDCTDRWGVDNEARNTARLV